MSKAACTLKVFAAYLCVLGALLLGVPDLMLSTFGFPPSDEVWIRVLGLVVFNLGVYYAYAAISEARLFFMASVFTRLFALLVFGVLVVLGLAPPMLALFGVLDALGGLWTWRALRHRDRARA